MNFHIPRWSLVVLACVLVTSAVTGLMLERTAWAQTHPYQLNLLSALTGFAASGLFAALVVNRARRHRYWRVELDRRTWTLNEVDRLLASMARAFALTAPWHNVPAALQDRSVEMVTDSVRLDTTRHALIQALTADEVSLRSPDGYPDGRQISAGFEFLSDSRIDYLGDRLDRKARNMRLLLNRLFADASRDELVVESCTSACELAEAASELRDWLNEAPSSRMRRAVRDRAYSSSL